MHFHQAEKDHASRTKAEGAEPRKGSTKYKSLMTSLCDLLKVCLFKRG